MRSHALTIAVLAAMTCGCMFGSVQAAWAEGAADDGTGVKYNYPQADRVDHKDSYHGVDIPDPYRWLEDPDSAETRAWVEAENAVTGQYLSSIPQREEIRTRLTKLWDYDRIGIPMERGPWYFYSKNTGLQNQSVMYVAEGPQGEPRVLLDPNLLSEDGTVALGGTALSQDGNLLAYSISASGSDWREWKVRDVRTGQDLPDHLLWSKFSGASWMPDGSGFYYARYDEPKPGEEFTASNFFQKLFFHKLGTPQAEDKLVYERPDEPKWGFDGHVTEDGDYLIISISHGTERKNRLYYQDLKAPHAQVTPLIDAFEAEYDFVANHGPVFYFRTDNEAPRGRLIAVNVNHPQPEHWQDVIPQSEDTLISVSEVGGKFFTEYLKDAYNAVRVFAVDGTFEKEVAFPALGSVAGFGGYKTDEVTYYSFTCFTYPTEVYRYDIAAGTSTLVHRPEIDFRPEDYETKQVFYPSRDGTKIPMFVTCKKGTPLDGNQPTLLYGYGGFNISQTPGFSLRNLVWMEQGGVYAVANLRGGGEYGRSWHESGMLDRKQNVFDDFIGAAQWLIDNQYTCPNKLAINGGSNGGLLVGACMTQRPDLFRAALPAVGVMDMLRFHKFTIGWAWVPEYGSSDDADQFRNLLRYSPLQNLRPGTSYPATLVTTADHDDRVVPAHSFKFAAMLQHVHAGQHPVLIRIETKAGHGAGKPTGKLIEEATDVLSFLVKELGVE